MFDNVKLEDMGLIVVDVGTSGMKEIGFGVKRNIVEDTFGSNRYFIRVDKEPLVIPITLALKLEYKFDYEKRRDIVNLLFQDEYKILVSEDNPQICYYCIVEGESKRFDNYLNDGYVTLNFRCDAPHGWSYPVSTDEIDLSDNTTSTVITLDNLGNVDKYYLPEIEIELVGDATSVSLRNLSDEGREFKFMGLQHGETIYISNKNKRIKSSLGDDVYRLEKFNKQWLRLLQGQNHIEVIGKCIIRTRMQFLIAL